MVFRCQWCGKEEVQHRSSVIPNVCVDCYESSAPEIEPYDTPSTPDLDLTPTQPYSPQSAIENEAKAVEQYQTLISSTCHRKNWNELPTIHTFNLGNAQEGDDVDGDLDFEDNYGGVMGATSSAAINYSHMRSAVGLKNVSQRRVGERGFSYNGYAPQPGNRFNHTPVDTLDSIRALMEPNLIRATQIDTSRLFVINIEEQRRLSRVGQSKVEFGDVVYYDCAFDSLIFGLMAGLCHVQSRFPYLYRGNNSLTEGKPISSLMEYSKLSVMNKLTCSLNRTQEVWNDSNEYHLVDYAQKELYIKFSDYCKSIYVNYENPDSKVTRFDIAAPSLFVHHFATSVTGASPFVSAQKINDLIDLKTSVSALTDEEREWLGGKVRFFSGEMGASPGMILGGSKEELKERPDWSNHEAILTEGDNYVQALLDYIKFFYQTIRYGFKGTVEMLPNSNGSKTPVGKVTSVASIEDKGVILPYLHTNFLHYYAQNLQLERVLRAKLSSKRFGVNDCLRYTDGTSTVEGLTPSLVPLRSTTYNLGYKEPRAQNQAQAETFLEQLVPLSFSSTSIHQPPIVGNIYNDMTVGYGDGHTFLKTLMGISSRAVRNDEDEIKTEEKRHLLTIDTAAIFYDDDGDYSQLHPLSKIAFQYGIFSREVLNGEHVHTPLPVFSKRVLEGILQDHYEIGDMFKLDVQRSCSMYFFGELGFDGDSGTTKRTFYAPVAVIFCNADLRGLEGGGSQGHFWVECKLPSHFGTPTLHPPNQLMVNTGDYGRSRPVTVPEGELWFRYDNMKDEGSKNWDLLVDEHEALLPLHGGALDKDGRVVDTSMSKGSRIFSRNYRPCRSDPFSMRIIKEKYVSLESAENGNRFKDTKDYKMMFADGEGEWYLIFNPRIGNVSKIDSVIYARVDR